MNSVRKPAPRRSGARRAATVPAMFVVQEHWASTHHFDFRLERDGVLKSWALPKGFPEHAGDRRLAIAVDDHPLSWATFEGVIPEGQYGAGRVRIWDRGTFRLRQWSARKISFTLSGEQLGGDFVLVPYPHGGPDHWLLIKTHTEAAEPSSGDET